MFVSMFHLKTAGQMVKVGPNDPLKRMKEYVWYTSDVAGAGGDQAEAKLLCTLST